MLPSLEHWTYLFLLLVSLGGLASIDYRYKLAIWNDFRRTLFTVITVISVFIAWDLTGIAFGIFFIGHSEYMLPYQILPGMPIEELGFLFLLCYVSLLTYRGIEQWHHT